MKKISYNGLDYDIVIIDNSICLQNLHQDVVFENGYTDVMDSLEQEWVHFGAKGSLRDYQLEHEEDAIIQYIKLMDGVVVVNNVN